MPDELADRILMETMRKTGKKKVEEFSDLMMNINNKKVPLERYEKAFVYLQNELRTWAFLNDIVADI
ncbi:hypothetical protein [Pseudomonas fluorescens]|uniref:hypothetical protein n=1 Tax=Pseudomonas fluorescens TaxID=294 RepID=UPI001BE74C60|nr:hypothetical protein [Pseudomonas fluorescens]MBT2375766.1 hypothetical protein [Pseudomonas fluorescens]